MTGPASTWRALDLTLASLLAIAAAPLVMMALWWLEQTILGTRTVSAFCHAVNIDEPLDELFRWIVGA